jgi:pSer/pThr/pTyr-binding forkhead associated (FHA) protein
VKAERDTGGSAHLLFDLAQRICLWGGLDGRVLKIALSGGSLKLGRNASSVELPLDDPWISRQHVAFFPSADGVEVEDLSTANGTLLNGKRIRRERLADGDCLEVGDRMIRLHILPADRTIL